MREKKCKNCKFRCDSTVFKSIGTCNNPAVLEMVKTANDDDTVYFNDEFGCMLWKIGVQFCTCGNPSGKIVASSPIDTVDTCMDCGKPRG